MDKLSIYEIEHIMNRLDIRHTIIFSSAIGLNLSARIINKNKNELLIEQLYAEWPYLGKDELRSVLETCICSGMISCEDLICFMANLYPNRPKLSKTMLFGLLVLYDKSAVDWDLLSVHFRFN
jgi:hypothetical protein